MKEKKKAKLFFQLPTQEKRRQHQRCMLVSLVLLGFLQSLLQKADVGGRGRVLEACREAKSGSFLLWLHGSLVKEEVGIDVVDLERQKPVRIVDRIRRITTAKSR